MWLSVLILLGHVTAWSQSPAPTHDQPNQTIPDRLTELRDAFVTKAEKSGIKCRIQPPTIVLTDIASFGNYDPETNTLRTPLWSQFKHQEKTLFMSLAGPNASDEAAQVIFERGTHSWVFIHEMGHWWQTCVNANVGRSHYRVEYDANRIAAAYWREVNPQLMESLASGFDHILAGSPNPVPSGQDPEAYFNHNYEKLAGSPEYTWFQAHMIAGVNAEVPPPSFLQALYEPGK